MVFAYKNQAIEQLVLYVTQLSCTWNCNVVKAGAKHKKKEREEKAEVITAL